MFEVDTSCSSAKITVVGVGGGGISAVNRIISKLNGAKFIAVDTDATAFSNSQAPIHIKINDKSPQEIQDEIIKSLEGAEMVFIVAGMGGNTASRLAPIIAAYSKGLKALTIAAVTYPSSVEDLEKKLILEEKAALGLRNLRENTDTTIIISIDKLLKIVDNRFSLAEVFYGADEILSKTVQGVSSLINTPGLVNLDFCDLKTMLQNSGTAFVGIGEASGKDAIFKAAHFALTSPTMNNIQDAHSILINFTGAENSMTLMEVNDASSFIMNAASPEAAIMWGMSLDDNFSDNVRVVILATSLYS